MTPDIPTHRQCILITSYKAKDGVFPLTTYTHKNKHVTHSDGGFLRASLLCIGVEQDISATPLAVLVDYQSDLTGLQLGDWPAKQREEQTGERGIKKCIKTEKADSLRKGEDGRCKTVRKQHTLYKR